MSSPQRRSVDRTRPFLHSTTSSRSSLAENDARGTLPIRPSHSRQPSAAAPSTSIGGVLDAAVPGKNDSIAESSNNAIAVLLQRPILRTGLLPHTNVPTGQRLPSSRDIPPVTLSNIPLVDNKAFKTYLQQAGALYDALQRAKDGPEDSRPLSQGRAARHESSKSESLPHGMQRRSSSQGHAPSTEATVAAAVGAPQFRRRSSGGGPKRGGLQVAPLSTIPNVYFDDDFRLENPRTFDVVSERAEIARPPAGANGSAITPGSTGKKALAANAILQEKLSWYMDTVEIHLIASISTASTSFFAALGSLRELHAEASQSVGKIRVLREDLQQLDDGMAAGGLKILALKRRRENLRKLGQAVEQLERIVQLVTECEGQVDAGEVETALKGLANVELLMGGELPMGLLQQMPGVQQTQQSLVDLRGLRALEGVHADISFLRKRIGRAYESKFIETMLSDLKRHINSVPQISTFQRWDKASSRLRGQHVRTPSELPSYLSIDGEFRSTLLSQLKGLARSDSLTMAAITYRESILREIKRMIQRQLPSSSDDDVESTTSIATHASRGTSSQEKSSILKRNVRNLEPVDAEAMFKKVYSNVGEALRRLGTQVKVILDITSSLNSPHLNVSVMSPPLLRSPSSAGRETFMNAEPSPGPPPVIHQEEIQQALDLSSLLGQAVDIEQSHIVKLLKVRADQTITLEMPLFLKYFTLNRLFADECEAVSGRSGIALKSVVQEHIKAYVSRVAQEQTERLIENMNADKWDARDFAEQDTKRLGLVMAASTQNVEPWARDALIWDEDLPSNAESEPHVTNGVGDAAAKAKTRSAVIDEEHFMLPESAIAVLAGVETFERLLTGIPNMAADIATALLDYLRQFKSRSSQLVLGAGATRSAGLKNITTKHLAVSSRATSFVVALIPYLREFARRHLPAGGGGSNVLVEFDKVKRMLQEQQVGLQDKFVEIMAGRATAHVGAMGRVDWDHKGPPEDGGGVASGYMETLVKETTTLHKVLARYLPEANVRAIIEPVLRNYKEQLGPAFEKADASTPAGKAW